MIKKVDNGQYRFNLKAQNGDIIARSETYTSKAGIVLRARETQGATS